MNEQNEQLIRQSKWSGKRVLLLYWTAILFFGTATASGLGTSILNPRYKFDDVDHSGFSSLADLYTSGVYNGEPFHPEDCSTCHSGKANAWEETKHSWASVYNGTHVLLGNLSFMAYTPAEWNASSCAQCHTTRWENSTGTPTYWDYGVTCASCHEEPGVLDYSAENCGKCHSSDVNPIYQDYNNSHHAESLDDLLASDHPSDSCLHCMSGQGTYQEDLSLDDEFLTSIVCSTCHDAHDVAGNPGQLRAPSIQELCGKCHSSSSRHTTYEMLTDATTTSKHGSLDCTKCHGYQLEWGSHNEVTNINHTWVVPISGTGNETACGQDGCHEADSATRIATLNEIQANTTDLMDLVTSQIDNVTAKVDEANDTVGNTTGVFDAYQLISEANTLWWFVNGDMSEGFHNPDLAEEKLLLALDKLDSAYAKAVEELEAGKSTPGFSFGEVFAIFAGIAIVALLIRRKKR